MELWALGGQKVADEMGKHGAVRGTWRSAKCKYYK